MACGQAYLEALAEQRIMQAATWSMVAVVGHDKIDYVVTFEDDEGNKQQVRMDDLAWEHFVQRMLITIELRRSVSRVAQ